MATVVNRANPRNYRVSVNSSYYPIEDWVHLSKDDLPNTHKKYWVVDGEIVREMTSVEKDAAVATWKAERLADLDRAVLEYGEGFYPSEQIQWILIEFSRAKAELKISRVNYLQPVVDFNDLISSEYKSRRDEILAAKTHDEVLAVSLDFSNLNAQAPAKVSVADAREMN